MRLQNAVILVLAAATLGTPRASAQISDDVVRIGVLNDQSGLYADLGGQGSVVAARMAVEDAGGSVLGKPVEIIFADHQNKADIGMAVSRRWFEAAAVDMAIGFDGGQLTIETGNPFLDDGAGCRRRRSGPGSRGRPDDAQVHDRSRPRAWIHGASLPS
jgi:hypothetical protein